MFVTKLVLSVSYMIADLSRALSVESDDAPYYIKMIVDKEEGFRCWNSIGKFVKSAAGFFNINEPDFDFNKFVRIVKVMNDRNASLSNN